MEAVSVSILAPVTPHWHDQDMAEAMVGSHESRWSTSRPPGSTASGTGGLGGRGPVRCLGPSTQEQWYSLVNSGCPMGASEIHGITDAAVAHAPSGEHIVVELLAQLGGAVLVGHNVTFDWRFLSSEYARGRRNSARAHNAVCTLALARSLHLPTENMKLDSVTAYCRVSLPRAHFHDAREDVGAAAGVFSTLYPMALEQGINPLDPFGA